MWSKSPALALIVALASLVASCSLGGGHANTPEGAVLRCYDAVAEDDTDAYLDCLTPEARAGISPFMLRALGQALLGVDVGTVRLVDPQLQVISNNGRTATVRLTGNARSAGLGMEFPIEVEHEVRAVNGRWLLER